MGPRREPEDHSVVPQPSSDCDLERVTLTPAEAYLLSRVDGRTPWSLLRQVGGMAAEEVDACLRRLAEEGVVTLEPPKPEDPPASAPGPDPAGEGPADPRLVPGLDIPVEAQRELLAFEATLDRPYHEILGVAPDAGLRELRRAYFALSKEFHPDRYFRRDVGPFAERIQRVFRRIAEAFELLSDPSARKEMERSAAAAPSAGPAAPRLRGRTTPHAFSLLARIDRERRRKARRYFESGRTSITEERWVEAAQQLRLAVACDPSNSNFKEPFSEATEHANRLLADRYIREADASYELGEYAEAYKRYVDALHRRPFQADANHRAALLAWRIEGDLKAAKEYAACACEVEPEVAVHRKTLGQVYAAAGLYKNAQRELEQAVKLDPRDEEAKLELKTTRRMARRAPLGGS